VAAMPIQMFAMTKAVNIVRFIFFLSSGKPVVAFHVSECSISL
jgi:hypothetical protein